MPCESASRLGVSLFNETLAIEWVSGRPQKEGETILRWCNSPHQSSLAVGTQQFNAYPITTPPISCPNQR